MAADVVIPKALLDRMLDLIERCVGTAHCELSELRAIENEEVDITRELERLGVIE